MSNPSAGNDSGEDLGTRNGHPGSRGAPGAELRILLLEDDPDGAARVDEALQLADTRCTVLQVDSAPAFTAALESFAPDVVLSDHSVADLDAFQALRLIQAHRPGCPLLLVAGRFEQTASVCLKAGAVDFVRKSELSRLGPAIQAAIELCAPLRRLSRRQIQVLQLLATGHSMREAAALLSLSVKTVETHRAQLMQRLGIRDLAGLVRYAISTGAVSASH